MTGWVLIIESLLLLVHIHPLYSGDLGSGCIWEGSTRRSLALNVVAHVFDRVQDQEQST